MGYIFFLGRGGIMCVGALLLRQWPILILIRGTWAPVCWMDSLRILNRKGIALMNQVGLVDFYSGSESILFSVSDVRLL
jgi:hypothetical protein